MSADVQIFFAEYLGNRVSSELQQRRPFDRERPGSARAVKDSDRGAGRAGETARTINSS
jgi:hypothetical protein